VKIFNRPALTLALLGAALADCPVADALKHQSASLSESQDSAALAARLEQARKTADQGDTEAALAAYRKISADFGGVFEADYAIAWLEAKRGAWKSALDALEKALPQVPQRELGPAHELMGQIRYQLKDYESAAAEWQIATQYLPQNDGLRFQLGTLYEELGPQRLPQAVAVLEEAVALAPERARYRLELGFAYENLGRLDQARNEYQRGAALIPQMPHAWARLGALEARLGQDAPAEQHLRRALQVDPDFILALFQLGNLLRRQGKLEEARPYLERFDQLRKAARSNSPTERGMGGSTELKRDPPS
jgi:tetratricopeptide (TPR) repeat protein